MVLNVISFAFQTHVQINFKIPTSGTHLCLYPYILSIHIKYFTQARSTRNRIFFSVCKDIRVHTQRFWIVSPDNRNTRKRIEDAPLHLRSMLLRCARYGYVIAFNLRFPPSSQILKQSPFSKFSVFGERKRRIRVEGRQKWRKKNFCLRKYPNTCDRG